PRGESGPHLAFRHADVGVLGDPRLHHRPHYGSNLGSSGRLHDVARRDRARLALSGPMRVEPLATVEPATASTTRPAIWRNGTLAASACLTGLTVTGGLVLLHGHVLGSIVIGVVMAAAIVTVRHPRWGYYLLVSAVILSDHFLWNFSPWTDR